MARALSSFECVSRARCSLAAARCAESSSLEAWHSVQDCLLVVVVVVVVVIIVSEREGG